VLVMRDGALVGMLARHEIAHDEMVRLMIGRALKAREALAPAREPGAAALSARGVRTPAFPRRTVDLDLRRGEILGLAGLVGSGRTELARVLFGIDRSLGGSIALEGRELALASAVDAVRNGIFLVPEDRKLQGLVLSRPALTNVTLPGLRRLSTLAFIQRRRQRREAKEIAASVGFSPKRLRSVAGTLSGGNQQKLVIGKWLAKKPGVLLLDEPTRGVDIGAKREIYETVRRIADAGTSVILVSSDLEEVVEQSDRILVMARGRGIATLMRSDASVERILNLIFGVSGGNGNGK